MRADKESIAPHTNVKTMHHPKKMVVFLLFPPSAADGEGQSYRNKRDQQERVNDAIR